jgi:hypothetical protein
MSQEEVSLKTKTGRWIAGDKARLRNLQMLRAVGKDVIIAALKAQAERTPVLKISLEDIAKEANVAVDELHGAVALTMVLYGPMGAEDEYEPYKDVIADLVSAKVIDQGTADDVVKTLDGVISESGLTQSLKKLTQQRILARTVFPQLDGMWAGCVMLQEFEPRFTRKDTPESYNPKLQPGVPAVAVQIDIDCFGDKKRFSFSLLPEQLDDLINRLRLAAKQLAMLKKQ